jgi:hypothetical protein
MPQRHIAEDFSLHQKHRETTNNVDQYLSKLISSVLFSGKTLVSE